MSRHRHRHRKKKKIMVEIIGLLAVLGLVGLFVFSNMRYQRNLEIAGTEDEVTAPPTTTTTAPLQPVEANEAILNLPFNYIAYSKINGIAPRINTEEHYRWCGKKDFTSIKGDVQITADGKLVMCHDVGFTLDENGKITTYKEADAIAIRDLTEEECLALRHAGWNSKVCNFETYIQICKQYNKIAYITVLDEYIDEVIPEMMRILEEYGMIKQSIVNSYSYSTLQAIRAQETSITLSLMLKYGTALTKEDIDQASAIGNCVVTDFSYSNASTVADVEKVIDKSVLEYAEEKEIRIYEAQVHSMAIANALKKHGISGAQMMVAPDQE